MIPILLYYIGLYLLVYYTILHTYVLLTVICTVMHSAGDGVVSFANDVVLSASAVTMPTTSHLQSALLQVSLIMVFFCSQGS